MRVRTIFSSAVKVLRNCLFEQKLPCAVESALWGRTRRERAGSR